MPAYAYRCNRCGEPDSYMYPMGKAPATLRCANPDCTFAPDGELRRDYRAENVGINIHELKKTSAHKYDDSLFLPSAKDFESKSDPDGSKGIRNWNENHEPRETNKRPKRPKTPAGSRKVL